MSDRVINTSLTNTTVLRERPPQGEYAKVLELIDTVLMKEILEPTREYLRLNEGVLQHTTEANQQLSQRLTLGLVGLGICGSAGGLLAGWVIATSLRRSLLKTDEVLRDTAALLDAAVQVPIVRKPGDDAPHGPLQRVTEAAAAVLQRLKQTERDALCAEQLAWVGQMAAGIAHEVRNPLTAIKLLVQAATDPRRSTGFRPARFASAGRGNPSTRTDHQHLPRFRPAASTGQEARRRGRLVAGMPGRDSRHGRSYRTSRSGSRSPNPSPPSTPIPVSFGRSSII